MRASALGQSVAWLIVVAALISAGNALIRKIFDLSVEFLARAAVVAVRRRVPARCTLDAGPQRAHPHRHRERAVAPLGRNTIEIFGHVFFLLPMTALVAYTSWPFFFSLVQAERAVVEFRRPAAVAGEASDPRRLRAPVRCRALSELIKRIAIIDGDLPEDGSGAPAHAAAAGSGHLATARRREPRRRPRSSRQVELAGTPGRRQPMLELIAQNLAPIMFASLVVFLLLGYPVAFSLAAVGLIFFVIGVELAPSRRRDQPLLAAAAARCPNASPAMSNETLLAIPFFTFMGLILERSGMAEDLLDTIGQLFGTLRGGLAYAVVFVGALLAATTGVVAASVISMGLISLPIMLRYGYDRRLASGVIAASGTLAQIIPPSLVLIVLADQLGRSVGDMYEGAFVPGLVLAILYAVYVFLASMVNPKAAPGLPVDAIGYREPDGARGLAARLLVLRRSSAMCCRSASRGPSYPDDRARTPYRAESASSDEA